MLLVQTHTQQQALFDWYSLGGSAVLYPGFRKMDPLSIFLRQECTSIPLEKSINVLFSIHQKKFISQKTHLSYSLSPAPISAEVSQGFTIPASEILDQLTDFPKATVDLHWAVLRFFALNPALLPSLLSKGEEQVSLSVSDRPADSPPMYLDCGWSKVNWGRGM